MAGRTLDDVFDYFVPIEEQRAARRPKAGQEGGKTDASPAQPAREPLRWCLAIDPERLLHCAFAVDLAAGLARDGRPARIVSTFERPRLAPGGDWRVAEPAGLAALLESSADDHAIAVVRPDEVPRVVTALRFDGLILASDTRADGLRDALGQLRRLRPPEGMRIGVVLLGATPHEASAAFGKLERAARRQLGRSLEALGSLQADETSRRALLHGRPTLEVDAGAASTSAKQILALCERLRTREAA
jgi:hypothetical protein